jgi:DNA-binding NarL/FixJ family response regulator
MTYTSFVLNSEQIHNPPFIQRPMTHAYSFGGFKILMVPARPTTYSIVLAHPLTLVREGLAALCQQQPQYRVVDQCSDGATALRLIESGRPDIAVLDLNLPDLFTLEIVRRLRLARAETRIVVLSARKDRKTVVEALRSGVNAFLLKSGPAHQFMQAFEQILDGGIYISPMLELHQIFSPRQTAGQEDRFAALSPREFQVFSLLVEGTRAKEIGARLGLNPKTIDTYRVNLMRKLDIHDVAGLVKFAIQRDLVSNR